MCFWIGFIAGIFTGLGMGGGSIVILCLTSFLHQSQQLAQGTTLIYYIATSISAMTIYLKNKKIDSFAGQKLLVPVIIGATLGAYLTKHIVSQRLRKYFGFFLGGMGMLDILMTLRKKKGEKEK